MSGTRSRVTVERNVGLSKDPYHIGTVHNRIRSIVFLLTCKNGRKSSCSQLVSRVASRLGSMSTRLRCGQLCRIYRAHTSRSHIKPIMRTQHTHKKQGIHTFSLCVFFCVTWIVVAVCTCGSLACWLSAIWVV